MIEGIAPPPSAPADSEPAPATQASFTFRFEEATGENDSLMRVMATLCATVQCGVVMDPDPDVQLMRVIALLGAAFPNSLPGPQVHFVVPAD